MLELCSGASVDVAGAAKEEGVGFGDVLGGSPSTIVNLKSGAVGR